MIPTCLDGTSPDIEFDDTGEIYTYKLKDCALHLNQLGLLFKPLHYIGMIVQIKVLSVDNADVRQVHAEMLPCIIIGEANNLSHLCLKVELV